MHGFPLKSTNSMRPFIATAKVATAQVALFVKKD